MKANEPYLDDIARHEDIEAARFHSDQLTCFHHLPLNAYHRTDLLTVEERLTKHLDECV